MLSWALFLLAGGEPSLEWTAPQGCPSEDEIRDRLRTEAVELSDAQREAVSIVAEVREEAPGQWNAVVIVSQPSGVLHRTFTLDSCAAAAETVPLVFALAVSSDTELDPIEPEPEPEPEPELEPKSEPEPEPEQQAEPAQQAEPEQQAEPAQQAEPEQQAEPAQRAEPELRGEPRTKIGPPSFGVSAEGGARIGGFAPAGGLVGLGLGVSWGHVRIDVVGQHAIRRRVRVDRGVGANLSTTLAGLTAGYSFFVSPATITPRAGVLVGGGFARGVGGVDRTSTWVPWAEGLVGGLANFQVAPRWSVRLGADLRIPLVRHRFVFDTALITRTRQIAAAFTLGVEFHFPASS